MSDDARVVSSAYLRDWRLPDADDASGKDSRGSVVVIGGALDTPGAVMLAGLAALRVGAGRLSIATVAANASALAVAVPEAAVAPLPATAKGSLGADAADACSDLVTDADTVILGPGLRDPDSARELVHSVLDAIGPGTVVVLDALGLTCGGMDDDARKRLSDRLVATPNHKEARFLLAGDVPAHDLDAAAAIASSLGAVVTLRSSIAAPDGRRWVDESGNSGLGTSGSGDVLAGAIAGLAARGATPDQAAVWGAHVHAEAGERLAARVGRLGFLARELLDELPAVLTRLER